MPLELKGRQIEAIHLGLVMVDPGYRTQGLSGFIWLDVHPHLLQAWTAANLDLQCHSGAGNHRQGRGGFCHGFPNPFEPTRRTFEHVIVAREIMRKHRRVFGVASEPFRRTALCDNRFVYRRLGQSEEDVEQAQAP